MASKLLACLLLLLLTAGTAHAQQNLASETFKQRLRGQYLHNDTAQAIITLYSTRQLGGASWVAAALLAAARIATAAPTNNSAYGATTARPDAGAAFLVSVPIIAYGVGKVVHFSNGKLERVLTDYAAGKPLARPVQRKLKPRFFAQPIIEYKTVPVKAVPVQAVK